MATHEIITRIEIAAPVERVWSILADFTQYPRWNPFIRSVSGIARRGERLRVSIQPKGRRAMTFRPRRSYQMSASLLTVRIHVLFDKKLFGSGPSLIINVLLILN